MCPLLTSAASGRSIGVMAMSERSELAGGMLQPQHRATPVALALVALVMALLHATSKPEDWLAKTGSLPSAPVVTPNATSAAAMQSVAPGLLVPLQGSVNTQRATLEPSPGATAAASRARASTPHAVSTPLAGNSRVAANTSKQLPPQPVKLKYLMLLGAAEGMSGWVMALQEAMQLAKRLGRVFVLPCVRGSSIIPCTDNTVDVPDGTRAADIAAAWAGNDTMALPAFAEDCNDDKSLPVSRGRVYPLHAYFSRAGIASIAQSSGGVDYIDYRTWARDAVEPWTPGMGAPPRRAQRAAFAGSDDSRSSRRAVINSSTAALPRLLSGGQYTWPVLNEMAHNAVKRDFSTRLLRRPSDGRIIVPYPLLMADDARPYNPCNAYAGSTQEYPYLFPARTCMPKVLPGSSGSGDGSRARGRKRRTAVPTRGMDVADDPMLREAPWVSVHTLFFSGWFRSHYALEHFDKGAFPAFNALHLVAVKRWLAQKAGAAGARPGAPSPPYAVVQWRSETVKNRDFPQCAAGVEQRTRGVSLAVRRRGGKPLPIVVLVADLPYQGNNRRSTCQGSRNYDRGQLLQRAGSMARLLTIPGLQKYDMGINASTALINGGPGQPVDAGVLSIRDYLLAVHANWLATCQTRKSRGTHSELCSRCFWKSEYIQREVAHRTSLGMRKSTFTDLWKMNDDTAFSG